MTIIVSITAIAGRRLVLQRPSPCFGSGEVQLIAHISVGNRKVHTTAQPVAEDPVLGLTVTFRDALTIEVPDTATHRSLPRIDALKCEFTVRDTQESAGEAVISLSKRWMRLEPLGGEALVGFSVCRVEGAVPQKVMHPESWSSLHRANIEDTERAITNYSSDRQLIVSVVSCEGLALPIAQSSKIRWFATFAMKKSKPSMIVATSSHYHPIAGTQADTAFFHRATWPITTTSPSSENQDNNNSALFLVHANNCSTELTVHIEVVGDSSSSNNSNDIASSSEAAAASCDVGDLLQTKTEINEKKDLYFSGNAHRFSVLAIQIRVVPLEKPTSFQGLPPREKIYQQQQLHNKQQQQQQSSESPNRARLDSATSLLSATDSRRQSYAHPHPHGGTSTNTDNTLSVNNMTFSASNVFSGASPTSTSSSFFSASRRRSSALSPSPGNVEPETKQQQSPTSSSPQQQQNFMLPQQAFENLTVAAQVKIEDSISSAIDTAVGKVTKRLDDLMNRITRIEDRISSSSNSNNTNSNAVSGGAFASPSQNSSSSNVIGNKRRGSRAYSQNAANLEEFAAFGSSSSHNDVNTTQPPM